MAKRALPKPSGVDMSAPNWMVTYSDMVTQLLCFFILLFSYSVVQEAKFKAVLGSLRAFLGFMPLNTDVLPAARQRAPAEQMAEGTDRRGAPGKEIEVMSVSDGKKIVVGGKVLFDEGSALLLPEGSQILRSVADTIRGISHRLEIRGHAAAGEGAFAGLEDDWQIAWRRALAVMRFLVDECGIRPERLRLASAGAAAPAARNLFPEEASRNRRVEIVVTDELVR